MNSTLQLKLGFALLLVSIFLTVIFMGLKNQDSGKSATIFQESSKTTEIEKKQNLELKSDLPIAVAVVKPTPFIIQQGKATGKNSTIKFEKDLETSLKIQNIPEIWIEYLNENNESDKVELPAKAKEFINKRWLNTLNYSLQTQKANDYKTKVNINENYLNDAAVFATKIDDFPIKTSLGKRNISTEEAFDLMSLTASLAIERYLELQKMAAQINSTRITD